MRSRGSLLVLMPTVCFCVACTHDSGTQETPSVPEWTVEIKGRIGSLDDPDQLLTDVRQVLIGPEEQLFIWQRPQILVYDSTGQFVRSIGRQGQGPGELRFLMRIGLNGDTLYATDVGRVSYFSLEGEFLSTRAVSGEGFVRGPDFYSPSNFESSFAPLPDGGALVKVGGGYMAPSREAGLVTQEHWDPVFRTDSDLTIQDTVHADVVQLSVVGIPNGGEIFFAAPPFRRRPVSDLMPNGTGVLVVDQDSNETVDSPAFRATLIGPDKDTAFSTPIAYQPVPIAADLLARRLEEISDRPNSPGTAEIEEALRDADRIPETLPPVTGLALGQDGTIWIKREETLADSVLWQVLGSDGELRGELQLPKNQNVIAAQGDLMVAVELDALDVPYVVRYRVVR